MNKDVVQLRKSGVFIYAENVKEINDKFGIDLHSIESNTPYRFFNFGKLYELIISDETISIDEVDSDISPQINNCSNCGSDKIQIITNEINRVSSNGLFLSECRCTECNNDGSIVAGKSSEESESEAILRWNLENPAPSIREEIEETLDEMIDEIKSFFTENNLDKIKSVLTKDNKEKVKKSLITFIEKL